MTSPGCVGLLPCLPVKRATHGGRKHGERSPNPVEDEVLCAMFDESSQCTIVLPEECLGYGLVVPFHACGFALWFRIMKT